LVFKHCVAAGNRTPVSITSMMTGLYPTQHQIAIGRDLSPGETVRQVPQKMRVAPELFGEQGYETIAVSENSHFEKIGIAEAFDEYIRVPRRVRDFFRWPTVFTLLKYLPKVRSHGPGLTTTPSRHGHQTSFFTNDIAQRVLGGSG
jgi:arylsulfatase A-like enzyme